MGAISISGQCRQWAAVCFASLTIAVASSSSADEFIYSGMVDSATGAFTALTPPGSGMSGTILIDPTPGGSSMDPADLLPGTLLKMTAAGTGSTLFCFNYEIDPQTPVLCETGEVSVPITAVTGLNLTFDANGCPIDGTIDVLAFSPTFQVNVPITLDLGDNSFFADGDALGTVTGSAGVDCGGGGAPEIDAAPNPATPIDFGSVTTADAPQTQNIVITNSGDAALNVGTVAISGATDFTKTADTCTGAAVTASGGTCGITVTFTPATVGMSAATLTIPSDDADENPVTYSFSATVALALGEIATDAPLAIADTVVGEVMTGTVTVSNTGDGNLTVTSIETMNPLAAPFSVTADSCSTVSLVPMATCTITVQFAPGTDGLFMDSFDIVSDDPNNGSITVDVSATALPPPAPMLSVAPDPLNLAATMVNETSTGTITITNAGDADLLNIAFSGLVAPFSVMSSTCAGAVVPMDTCTATIEFAPTAEGMFSGTLMIASNDAASPAAVTVNGTGTMSLVPDIDVSPLTLTFTPQLFGDSEQLTVTVSNMGTADVAITDIAVAPMGEFTSGDDCPAALVPAATCTITVTFAPMTAGPLAATLTISTDSPGEETVTVPLSGTGVAPNPDIAVSPPGLDLGSLTVGVDPAVTGTVTVTNNGTANLNVSSVTILPTGDFSVVGSPCMAAVAPVGNCLITVSFLPSVVGPITADLTIVSDDPDMPMVTVTLSGQGLLAPEPNITAVTATDVSGATLDLGSAEFGESPMASITITNNGNADLVIGTLSVTGTNFMSFTPDGGCTGTVAQMTSCTILVTFTAAAPAGSKTATLMIPSNDPDTAVLTVALTATSVEPPPNITAVTATDMSGATLDLGSALFGQSPMAQSITITNTGTADLIIGTLSVPGNGFTTDGGCTGTVAQMTSCTILVTFTAAAPAGPKTATLMIPSNDPDMAVLTVALTATSVEPFPNIAAVTATDVSGATLDLGSALFGQSPMAQSITITNTGDADLVIGTLSVPGTDFTTNGGCTGTVAQMTSCTILVTFTAAAPAGPKTATLMIPSNDPDTPVLTVALMATSVEPPPDITAVTATDMSGATLDLGSALFGQSPMAQSITITNTGTADLVIGTLSVPGTDFTTNGGCTGTVAQMTSCTILVTFTAAAPAGPKTATLMIPSNDPDTPVLTVALTATSVEPFPNITAVTATDMTGATLDLGSALFGQSPMAQSITITNTGDADLVIGTLSVPGTDFTTNGGCTGTVAQMTSCTILVTFTAAAPAGPKTATLMIPSNDPDTPVLTVALTATSVEPPPNITAVTATDMSGATLDLGSALFGQSPMAQSITITNTGDADLVIGTLSVPGTDFTTDGGCTGTVAQMTSCTILVTFTAAAPAGPKTANLMIPSNDPDTPVLTVALTATSVEPLPNIAAVTATDVTGATLDLGSALFGQSPMAQSITITNTGDADLVIGTLSVPGTDFTTNGGCTGTVAQMTSCTILVTFTAAAPAGPKTATLMIPSNDPDTNVLTVALTATSVEPFPNIAVTPPSVLFGVVDPADPVPPRSVTVNNTGDAPLNVGPVSLATGTVFAQTNTCGAPVPVGGSCVITVAFVPTPMMNANYSDSLSITSNDPDMGVVTLNVTGQASLIPTPNIISDTASLDLGMVFLTQTSTPGVVTLTNNGNFPLGITSITRVGTDAMSFMISSTTCPTLPMTLASNSSCMVSITLTPTQVAPALTAALRIISDDPDNSPFDIALTGAGLMPLPDISVPTAPLNLGMVTIGANAVPATITVTNNGLADLLVSSVTTAGPTVGFTASSNCGTVTSGGGTCTVTVDFTPTSVGGLSDTLLIISTDPDTPAVVIPLSGTGVAAPAPNIVSDMASVSFGTVLIGGADGTAMVNISNTGDAMLNITDVAITGANMTEFGDAGCVGMLAPTTSCIVTVTFAAAAPAGTKAATMSVVSDELDSLIIPLSGVAAEPQPAAVFSTTALTLPMAEEGQTSTGTIMVTNTGVGPLVVSGIATSNAIAAPFTLTSETCTAAPIPNAGTCMLNFTFAPTAAGGFTDSFNFDSNDAIPSRILSLLGTATMTPLPAAVFSTTALTLPTAEEGQTSTGTIMVTNTGTGPLVVSGIATSNVIAAPFTLTSETCTAAPIPNAGTCAVNFTFAPTAAGGFTDFFNFDSNDAIPSRILSLLGTATMTPLPAAVFSTTALTLPTAEEGQTSTGTIMVTNSGLGPLVVSGIATSNVIAAPFTLTSETCTAAPIPNSGTCTMNFTFAPSAAGGFTDSFNFDSNDATPSRTVSVQGTATMMPVPPPVAVFSTTALTLPMADEGQTSTGTIMVTNSGTVPLVVSGIATSNVIAAPFTLTSETCTAAPVPNAGTCLLNFTFAPTAVGGFTDSFNFDSNDATPSRILSLQGTATMMPLPAAVFSTTALTLPTAEEGQTSTGTIMVTNSGMGPLVVSGIATSNVIAAPFTLTSETCTAAPIPNAGTCTMNFTFAPSAAGVFTDFFNFDSNDATPSRTVSVQGTATMIPVLLPVAEFSTTALTLPMAVEGQTSTGTIVVTNTGMGALVVSGIATSNVIAAPFTLTSETCTAAPIPNAGTCLLNFTFAPTAAGGFTDSFNFDSNDATPSRILTVQGTATMMPVPDMSVTTATLDLGAVLFGATSNSTVTVTNNGTANLTVAAPSIAPAGDFSTPDSCGVVAPMGVCTITITYAPTTAGSASATLTITSDDPDTATVSVALTGVGVMPVPDITVTPLVANLDSVVVGNSSTTTITVRNDGMADLTIGTVMIGGTGMGAYAEVNTCATVAAGNDCTVTVTFTPVVAGVATATLSITSNDADEGTVEVELVGIATPAPMPMISTPVSATIDDVLVGMTGVVDFDVTNTGTANLTVSAVTAAGAGFAVSAETCSAAPVVSMASCTVTASFTPTAEGATTGTISITSDDAARPEASVLVIANGTVAPMASVSVSDIDFQNVTVGANSTRSITISNGGSGVLTVTGLMLSGPDAADYNAPNTCVTISAGSSCDLMVTYTPSQSGSSTATLTITTDDPALNAALISLAAQASKIEEVIVAITNEGKGSFGLLDLLALALIVAIARRRRVLALVGAAALLATPAIAQDLPPAEGYWYAGAGIGSSTGQASEGAVRAGIEASGATVDSLRFDDSAGGWQGFVGYQATPRFAVELGYVDLGEAGIDLQLGAVNIDQLQLISRAISENASFLGDGVRGALIFKQPIGERTSFHARVGLLAWEITSGIGGTAGPDTVNLQEVESGTDFTYGFGGEVWFGPGKFGVRAEWERFEFAEQDAQMWSINGLFRF